MTVRDLKKVWVKDSPVCITALAYYKKSKEYYSFATIAMDRSIRSFTEETDKYTLDLQIKSIDQTANGTLLIDVIQWIDEDEESA